MGLGKNHLIAINATPARRKAAVSVAVLSVNLVIWLATWMMFGGNTVMIGSAVLAYSLGLRHAVDADHIAAIDNATRKLMNDGKQPVTVGLWFSLGHSTVVVLLSLLLVLTAAGIRQQLSHLAEFGSLLGVAASGLVLFVLAAMNACVLAGLLRTFRSIRRGEVDPAGQSLQSLVPTGLMGRAAARLFRLISASWQLYPLGLLFGLGFDTATEIGLLGLSAASAVKGLGLWTIMIFPALFTAGMSLIDTADSIMMLNVYSWSQVRPVRKLYYNLTVTAISVAVAVLVGAMEVLALLQAHLGLSGPFWGLVAVLTRNFGLLGYAVVLLFAASWIVSLMIYKMRGYDKIGMPPASAG